MQLHFIIQTNLSVQHQRSKGLAMWWTFLKQSIAKDLNPNGSDNPLINKTLIFKQKRQRGLVH